MSWGEFEDILQFGEENVLAAEEIAAQEENIGEPSSPMESAMSEPLVVEEALPNVEEMVIEPNIENPSTQTQSGATYSRIKGK